MMHYQHPLVLILNITVIIILILLILPNLLNKKEKIGVRLTFSTIFLVVIVNCIGNLIIFYFEKYNYLSIQFALMSIPFLFGPAIYFYVKEITGSTIRKVFPHLIVSIITLILGILYQFYSDAEKHVVINEMIEGIYLPYNLLNTLVMLIPQYYFIKSKIWLNKLVIEPTDPLYAQKIIKKKWAQDFINYMFFSVLSFLIISIILLYYYKIPQPYLDLIGMPIYFPFIYFILALKSNMISKELEIQYGISKSENELKLNEQRMSISRDLHDNMGAYANSLISKIDYLSIDKNSDNYMQMQDIKANAENILSLLRQTLWVLNNDEISAESSFDYVKNYALKIFGHLPVKLTFEENIVKNRILKSAEASNIFRIIQEALQNVMKHSKADRVKISISDETHFEISVEDNGIGFNETESVSCYGLKNMRHRAKNMGMELEIVSKIGDGTKVTVNKRFN